LEIVEPDEEEKFERNGDRRWNGRPLVKEDDCDRSSQTKVFE
jgi:hypothetical protein